MSFMEAVKTCFSKYVTFSGRARRSEYWYFTLFNFLVGIVLGIVDGVISGGDPDSVGIFGTIYSLAVFLPGLAVAIRRLHDTDRSGWWYLLVFIPIIGWIVLLVFFCTNGTEGENRFGHDPKHENEADVFS
ncbi:DUF805 domain-containing protein [Parasulfitobacter algicola]|uniref:DUF805 domain-containing protein n=1 Tax=Parasulfitobacter algicola TaxID=2614809 RepID=A0ABX2IZ56_9RHOB|nr:DUF805 domain-containing protein [Sulfitobacter algicola]NSX56497.1 DUF805 domain-containing protein [Sulfitobacter algicola]